MALMSPSLRVPGGASFSTLPVGSPHTCHPPDISATQISAMVPGARQRFGSRRGGVPVAGMVKQANSLGSTGTQPWRRHGRCSGSVLVNHRAVRAGQDAEDLV